MEVMLPCTKKPYAPAAAMMTAYTGVIQKSYIMSYIVVKSAKDEFWNAFGECFPAWYHLPGTTFEPDQIRL